MGDATSSGELAGISPADQRSYQERLATQRRRGLVARMRFVESMTETQIRAALAKLDPPIYCSQPTISRDIEHARVHFRKYFGNHEKFEATAEVAKAIARYENAAILTLRRARTETDSGRFAQLMRVHIEAQAKYIELLQQVGLIDKRLGTLFLGRDEKKSDKVPTGGELARMFQDVDVVEGEIISEAERAWLYGDAAAAVAAADGSVPADARRGTKDPAD